MAFCSVWNTFLSTCELTCVAFMVTRALSSWALKPPQKTIPQINNSPRLLSMQHIYNSINDIFCHLLFWFALKNQLLPAPFKNGHLVGIMAKTGTGVIQRVQHDQVRVFSRHLVQRIF